eukprot:CAMPEP_0171133606 /NCGR_PEP_ID=MMETSP0766_2-20121228/126561_1 /TAXON_ID=439317 /ORGANISM="Gambierdiscus australes, Strain CAWD 149" /LENGTH=93 /DNA_ID=CAMNT_0011597001 /DNA_START=391 /DNA_END=669 /DNA_ORIENTATION=+
MSMRKASRPLSFVDQGGASGSGFASTTAMASVVVSPAISQGACCFASLGGVTGSAGDVTATGARVGTAAGAAAATAAGAGCTGTRTGPGSGGA